jgi:hypothetical protein
MANFRSFLRADPCAKEEDKGLAISPNYTLDVRNGAGAFNLEGPTNGVPFPPSRRKDCKCEQEVSPTSLAGGWYSEDWS